MHNSSTTPVCVCVKINNSYRAKTERWRERERETKAMSYNLVEINSERGTLAFHCRKLCQEVASPTNNKIWLTLLGIKTYQRKTVNIKHI